MYYLDKDWDYLTCGHDKISKSMLMTPKYGTYE